MNLKRQHIGKFFTFLAGLIILAHAVVPHHHHTQWICVDFSHKNHEKNHSEESTGDCSHEHETENDAAKCILKQLVIVPSGQSRIEPVFFQIDNFTDYSILQPGYSNRLQFTELFTLIPYPKSSPPLQSLLTYTQGLRAPPAV